MPATVLKAKLEVPEIRVCGGILEIRASCQRPSNNTRMVLAVLNQLTHLAFMGCQQDCAVIPESSK